jgi:hypothetical protein
MAHIPTTFERRWPTVILTPIQVANHVITVPTTAGLHTKQKIVLSKVGLDQLELEIKRVISDTQLHVGRIDRDIASYENPIAYGGGTLTSSEQKRNEFGSEIVIRAVYEEEPAVALRNVLVNRWGEFYSTDNPLPVQLSDGAINIGTVNAELEVQLSHLDDYPNLGDVHDSVRIGSGQYEMGVNPDGSINVNIVEAPSGSESSYNVYGEASGVVAGSETLIVSFTPIVASKTYKMQRIEFTGEQIGVYRVYLNGNNISTQRTHHGSGLSGEIPYIGGSIEGIPLNVGDIVELKVLHSRPGTGSFEGRIQIYEASTVTAPQSLLTEAGDALITEFNDSIILEQ